MKSCDTYLEAIGNLHRGSLDASSRADLQQHLDACSDCSGLLTLLGDVEATAASAAPGWEATRDAVLGRARRARRLLLANIVTAAVLLPAIAIWLVSMPGMSTVAVLLSLVACAAISVGVLVHLRRQLAPRWTGSLERSGDLLESCRGELRDDVRQLEKGRACVAFAGWPLAVAVQNLTGGSTVVAVGLFITAAAIVAVFAHVHFVRLPRLRAELGWLER